MYLFFFRPQQKKQKEEAKFRTEITKGMRVVTTSGIHGKILELGDTTVVLESENSRIRVERTAISKDLSAQYAKTNPKAE
jgi:preprotein translocase subunit YajC